jgi:hypothetical protein
MMGSQCDMCRKFAPQPCGDWLVLVRQEQPSFLAAITGHAGTGVAGTFCSWRCVAEYAYVQAAAGDAAKGTET